MALEVWQLSTGQNLYHVVYQYQLPRINDLLMGYVSKEKNEQMKASGNVHLVNYSDVNLFCSTSFPATFLPSPLYRASSSQSSV